MNDAVDEHERQMYTDSVEIEKMTENALAQDNLSGLCLEKRRGLFHRYFQNYTF